MIDFVDETCGNKYGLKSRRLPVNKDLINALIAISEVDRRSQQRPSLSSLVDLNRSLQKQPSLLSLSVGLRPHLTKWQARFRAWYAAQMKDERNRDRAPQEIQRQFKDYEALVADLRQANQELVQLAKALHTIAQGA